MLLVFPENMGKYLSIDETAFSKGELYTIITNKKAKGKKGAIVAIINQRNLLQNNCYKSKRDG